MPLPLEVKIGCQDFTFCPQLAPGTPEGSPRHGFTRPGRVSLDSVDSKASTACPLDEDRHDGEEANSSFVQACGRFFETAPPSNNPQDWDDDCQDEEQTKSTANNAQEKAAKALEPPERTDFGFFWRFITNPLAMCKAGDDTFDTGCNFDRDDRGRPVVEDIVTSRSDECSSGAATQLREYCASKRVLRLIPLVLWPYLEPSGCAELRACCRQFERKAPQIFHSSADLIRLLSGGLQDRITACKCVLKCERDDAQLGEVFGSFNQSLAEMVYKKRDGLIIMNKEEYRLVKKARRVVHRWMCCRTHMGTLLWEYMAAQS